MATTPTKLTFLNKAAVFGSGAFGTALAMVLAKKSKSVKVWHMKQQEADLINQRRENVLFLKTVRLPQHVEFTADVQGTYEGADIIVFVIPTQFLRGFLAQHKKALCDYLTENPNVPVLVCSKGIEQSTLKFPAQILHEFLPMAKLSVLAGPSFAIEVANGKLTNVCVASEKIEEARRIARIMTTPDLCFRCWSSTDTVGCEVSSAMKNVLAIASGVNSGLGNGYNARASLISRGVLELRDLTLALGGNGEAIFGLAGLGDLLLTCSSELSRNFSVGEKLGKGMSLEAIQRASHAVAEGVATSEALHRLAERHGVKLRICSEVYRVLYKQENARVAFDRINSGRLMDEGLPPLVKMVQMESKV